MITTLRNITLEQLKKEYPGIYKAMQEEARNEAIRKAVLEDRPRVLSIMKYYHAQPKGNDLYPIVCKAIEDGTSLAVLQQAVESIKREKIAAEIKEIEFNKLTHLEKAKIYQNQKGCSMMEALRATAQRR